jgi:hypothetical protein
MMGSWPVDPAEVIETKRHFTQVDIPGHVYLSTEKLLKLFEADMLIA